MSQTEPPHLLYPYILDMTLTVKRRSPMTIARYVLMAAGLTGLLGQAQGKYADGFEKRVESDYFTLTVPPISQMSPVK